MKIITPKQKIHLSVLREKVKKLQAQEDALVKEAEKITGENEYTFDYMLNGIYETDELLDRLGMEVNGV